MNDVKKMLDAIVANEETIYVAMTAYCDALIVSTVTNMIATADHPERLHFGVCYQDDDLEKLEQLKAFPNCKVIAMAKKDAKGNGYAQYCLDTLYDNETYAFYTEGHMRCVKGWDTKMIYMLNQCGEKAILTHYMPSFDENVDCHMAWPMDSGRYIVLNGLTSYGHLLITYGEDINSDRPVMGAFTIGYCIFGRGRFVKDVPHDPDTYFSDTESLYNIRLWTHGYDLYYCNMGCLYHKYKYNAKKEEQKEMRASTESVVNGNERRLKAEHRMRVMLGIEDGDIDFGKYGLGKERTLLAYEQFAGVDFKKLRLTHSVLDAVNKKNVPYRTRITKKPYTEYIKVDDVSHCESAILTVGLYAYNNVNIVTTVQNMIYCADHPDRLRFVIYYNGHNNRCINVLKSINNCHLICADDDKSIGFAMNAIETYVESTETDYFMIVDPRIRCSDSWDDALIAMYKQKKNSYVMASWLDRVDVVSSDMDYVSAYPVVAGRIPLPRVIDESGQVMLALGIPNGIVSTTVCSVLLHFAFFEKSLLFDLKHDPQIESYMNETNFSIRAYTHGYDIVTSLYNYLHITDDNDYTTYINERNMDNSKSRMMCLVGDRNDIDLGEYGLGTKRSIKNYEEDFGISFADRSVRN